MRASTKKFTLRTLTVLIVLSLGVAAYHGVQSLRIWRWLARLQHTPMVLPVDFATPGVYAGPYRQTALPPFNRVEVYVDVPGRTDALDEVAFAGLVFDVTISAPTGVNVFSNGFRFDQNGGGNGIALATHGTSTGSQNVFRLYGMSFDEGDYTFTLTVTKPALALAAVKPTLRAEYLISVFPLAIPYFGIIAAIAASLALILWAVRCAVRRARVGAVGTCGECGYELRGNASAECPECGTPFEPHSLPGDKPNCDPPA